MLTDREGGERRRRKERRSQQDRRATGPVNGDNYRESSSRSAGREDKRGYLSNGEKQKIAEDKREGSHRKKAAAPALSGDDFLTDKEREVVARGRYVEGSDNKRNANGSRGRQQRDSRDRSKALNPRDAGRVKSNRDRDLTSGEDVLSDTEAERGRGRHGRAAAERRTPSEGRTCDSKQSSFPPDATSGEDLLTDREAVDRGGHGRREKKRSPNKREDTTPLNIPRLAGELLVRDLRQECPLSDPNYYAYNRNR